MDKGLKEHGIELRERIYQFIVKYIDEIGYAPTIREIGSAVGLKSSSSVYSHLTKLEMEGHIETKAYSPRAIKVAGYKMQKVEN